MSRLSLVSTSFAISGLRRAATYGKHVVGLVDMEIEAIKILEAALTPAKFRHLLQFMLPHDGKLPSRNEACSDLAGRCIDTQNGIILACKRDLDNRFASVQRRPNEFRNRFGQR